MWLFCACVRILPQVYEKALCDDEISQAIAWFETTYNVKSPFDSVYKLQTVVKKTLGKKSCILWVFQMIIDKLKSWKSSPKDWSQKVLEGAGGTGRGVIDLYLMKDDMRKYLCGPLLEKLDPTVDIRTAFADVFASTASYREKLSPLPVKGNDGKFTHVKPNLQWQTGWPKSFSIYVQFVEDTVYGEDYDTTLRTACRGCKSPADVMEFPSMKEKLAELLEMRKNEKTVEEAAAAPLQPSIAAGTQGEAAAASAGTQGEAAADDADGDFATRLTSRLVHKEIALFVEPDSQVELKEAILNSPVGKLFGEQGKRRPALSIHIL